VAVVQKKTGSRGSVNWASCGTCARFLGVAWQAVRATIAERRATQQEAIGVKNYAKAREAVQQMLTRVAAEHLGRIPEMKEVRQRLLEDAVTFTANY